MPSYVYRVSRRAKSSPLAVNPSEGGLVVSNPADGEVEPEYGGALFNSITAETDEGWQVDSVSGGLEASIVPEFSYRDLQRQAKAAGIKGNQPADKLRKALGVGNG